MAVFDNFLGFCYNTSTFKKEKEEDGNLKKKDIRLDNIILKESDKKIKYKNNLTLACNMVYQILKNRKIHILSSGRCLISKEINEEVDK
jgi:hypothetical protein